MWSKVGYPCLKPLASWFEDLKARVTFFNEWLQNVEMKCYWVPGFFFPQVSEFVLSELLFSGDVLVGHTTRTVDLRVLAQRAMPPPASRSRFRSEFP